ncbi:hypothetical protein N0V90_005983 [Kalmusia sp. IMI 367209]|nr:hypothetical protein N0V90_005983 [Kalmusia sp. IMI 367209]
MVSALGFLAWPDRAPSAIFERISAFKQHKQSPINELPQELVDRISDYLDTKDLENTLLLSQKFQHAAERKSGAFCTFTLTRSNASKFLSIYSTRRLRYLRHVWFKTSVFSREDEAEEDCCDTANELKVMDEDFTRQIRFLFETLQTLETSTDRSHGSGKIHLVIYTPTREINERGYCQHIWFSSWRVHLSSLATIPKVLSVRTFTMQTPERRFYSDGPKIALRKIDYRVLLDIASRLPNLELLQCNIAGDEWHTGFHQRYWPIMKDSEGPRRDSRHDFRKALVGFQEAASCLRHAQLDFLFPNDEVRRIDQREALPNLVKPCDYDPLSTSLRILSYPLRTLTLRGVADETLFWPADGSVPSWPNLESISVMFHLSTPSGTWYFRGLPGIGATQSYEITDDMYPPFKTIERDYDEDHDLVNKNAYHESYGVFFRTEPNENTLVPFLAAFAKATAFMPSLKRAALWCPLNFGPDESDIPEYEDFKWEQVSRISSLDSNSNLAWGVAYSAPGTEAFSTSPGIENSDSRQIWWRTAGWRPDTKLHTMFQEIGRDTYDEALDEYFVDDYAGAGLHYVDDFEDAWWRSFPQELPV